MIGRSPIRHDDLVRFDLEHEPAGALVAGVDEAGRGALAGPVVAAAVICHTHEGLEAVRDSKLVLEKRREVLYEAICERSVAWNVGIVSADRIDRINILAATLEAMRDAVEGLEPAPGLVLVDGRRVPDIAIPAKAVTGGDLKSFSIAAASIIAKVTRDRIMRDRDIDFSGYGFSRNKGYATREHIEAIRAGGLTAFHRRSFKVHSL